MSLASLLERSRIAREDWHYTDLSPWIAKGFQPVRPAQIVANRPAEAETGLIFVDGIYRPDLSNFGPFAETILQIEEEGYVLRAPEGRTEPTLVLRFLSTPQTAPGETACRLIVDLPAESSFTLLEIHEPISGAAPYAFCGETQIRLAAGAKLYHGRLVDRPSVHMAAIHVDIAAKALYDAFSLIRDGSLTRCEWEVALNGEEAQCRLHGGSLLRDRAAADLVTRILHNAPGGSSRQVFKSVLAEKAHGIFQGKIIVAPDAQKTDGYQMSRALLLSDQAEMNAKPALEIYADDVKCSHGSTVGALDEEALFYLRARGVPEAEARALLVRAFIEELAEGLPSEAFGAPFTAAWEAWLDD